MDDRARHADRTVEGETAFDLNTAIREWREELSLRPGFRDEDLEELEAHLREGIEELEQRGLSMEEAFLIASHRLGAPSALQDEFSRLNRHAVWLDRLVWMLLGYACVAGLLSLPSFLVFSISPLPRVPRGLPLLGWVVPVLLAGWIIQSIVREGRAPAFLRGLLDRPSRLALLGFAFAAVPLFMRSLVMTYVNSIAVNQWIAMGVMSTVQSVFVGLMILIAARYRLRLIRS